MTGRQDHVDANPSQAAFASPMLCFPPVLLSGAILPVHMRAGVGAAIGMLGIDAKDPSRCLRHTPASFQSGSLRQQVIPEP